MAITSQVGRRCGDGRLLQDDLPRTGFETIRGAAMRALLVGTAVGLTLAGCSGADSLSGTYAARDANGAAMLQLTHGQQLLSSITGASVSVSSPSNLTRSGFKWTGW
jgi:hypothetical protein